MRFALLAIGIAVIHTIPCRAQFPVNQLGLNGVSGNAEKITDDLSGGWIVGNRGFASKSRMSAGTSVSLRILQMGDGRGLVVTYSGDGIVPRSGKIWAKDELREGKTFQYAIGQTLAGNQLAIRCGAERGSRNPYNGPARFERSEGGYKLYFNGGRIVEVSVGGPSLGKDISGGWKVGGKGFASNIRVSVGAEVSLRVVKMGTGRAIAVTYSGNPQQASPGHVWSLQELQPGKIMTYIVGRQLAGNQLALRSATVNGDLAIPRSVESSADGHRLTFDGGRVVEVKIVKGNSPTRDQ